MDELIKFKNASKRFGKKVVLEDINLSIFRGQTMALIGPNGTGKSTLLRIIAGMSHLSSGERILNENGKKLKIGYVPEHFPKLNFTPYEYLQHMGKIQGLSDSYIKGRTEELFNTFNISSMKDTLIKYLSKGTIQKVAVMQAILDEPDILLLDEPLSGQDIASQDNFIETVLAYKKRAVSIILVCHEKYLVDKLADRVVSIEKGNIRYDMLNESADSSYMLICFKAPAEFDPAAFNQNQGIKSISQNGQLTNLLADKQSSDNIILQMLNNKCSIVSVSEYEKAGDKNN